MLRPYLFSIYFFLEWVVNFKEINGRFHFFFRTKTTGKTVDVEVVHGNYQFKVRRSPRRKTLPYESPAVSRRSKNETGSSKKLFTPSADFLMASPPKGSAKYLPSPIKFHVEEEAEDHNNGSENLGNIIESLPELNELAVQSFESLNGSLNKSLNESIPSIDDLSLHDDNTTEVITNDEASLIGD